MGGNWHHAKGVQSGAIACPRFVATLLHFRPRPVAYGLAQLGHDDSVQDHAGTNGRRGETLDMPSHKPVTTRADSSLPRRAWGIVGAAAALWLLIAALLLLIF